MPLSYDAVLLPILDHLPACSHVQVNVTEAEVAQCIDKYTLCPAPLPAEEKGSCPSGNTLEAGEAVGGLADGGRML